MIEKVERMIYVVRNKLVCLSWTLGCSAENKILNVNKDLKGIHSGETCFIIGNGPSLKNQDLSLLGDQFTFTVNRMAESNQYKKIGTNVHIWSDPDYFSEEMFELCGMEELLLATNSEGNKPLCFFPISVKSQIEKHKLNEILNIRYFKQNLALYDNYTIKFDPSKLLAHSSTVVLPAMMIAIYMGFTEINLLGCDCTSAKGYIDNYKNGGYADYGFDVAEEKSVSVAKQTVQKHSTEYAFNSYYNVFKDYRIMDQYCRNNGIKVYNCTEGGILDTFPCRTLAQALKHNKNDV